MKKITKKSSVNVQRVVPARREGKGDTDRTSLIKASRRASENEKRGGKTITSSGISRGGSHQVESWGVFWGSRRNE